MTIEQYNKAEELRDQIRRIELLIGRLSSEEYELRPCGYDETRFDNTVALRHGEIPEAYWAAYREMNGLLIVRLQSALEALRKEFAEI